MKDKWIFLFIILLFGCKQATIDTPENLAPDFTMQTMSGEEVTLSTQEGWTLVNFWATWCAPCIAEMPYLQQIADEGEMAVWGINMRDSAAEIAQFTAEHEITFPILLNPSDETILAYPGNLPRTYAIQDGQLAHTFYGPIDEEIFQRWWDSVQ